MKKIAHGQVHVVGVVYLSVDVKMGKFIIGSVIQECCLIYRQMCRNFLGIIGFGL
jgi:hypothetical protein